MIHFIEIILSIFTPLVGGARPGPLAPHWWGWLAGWLAGWLVNWLCLSPYSVARLATTTS